MKPRPLIPPTLRILALFAVAITMGSCAVIQTRDEPAERRAPASERPESTAPEETPPVKDSQSAEEIPSDAPDKDEGGPVRDDWDLVAAGQQSAVRVPVARSISQPGLWHDFWRAITANQADPPEVPTVDFDRSTVVVLILGERPTGGYSVGIAEIVERSNEVEVVVEVERPEAEDMVTQALTTPYFIAVIPITGKEFIFAGDSLEAGFQGD